MLFGNFNAKGQAGKPDLYSRTVFRYLIHNYECATRVSWRNFVKMVIKFWIP